MDIIRDNLPNIIYKQSYMSVNNRIFIYRRLDKTFRVEYECGQSEYYENPIDVLANYDIKKVKIFFPSLNEVIHIYG